MSVKVDFYKEGKPTTTKKDNKSILIHCFTSLRQGTQRTNNSVLMDGNLFL